VLGGCQVAADFKALQLECGRGVIVAHQLHLEAVSSTLELRRLAFVVAAYRQAHTREIKGAAVVLGQLDRRNQDIAIDIAAKAQAGLRGNRGLVARCGEPRRGEVVLVQRTVTGRQHRHQLERLDPRPGEWAVLDLVGDAHLEVDRLAIGQVDVAGFYAVVRSAAEEMLLQRGHFDGHVATHTDQGLLQLGIGTADGLLQLRRQLLAGVPGASGGDDGDGDGQAGEDAY